MTTRIEPTPGRVVWYTPSAADTLALNDGAPLAAIVAAVHADGSVNLAVFDAQGDSRARAHVTLVQDGEDIPEAGDYAQWMPYQLGQAAKTEAVAAKPKKAAKPAAAEPEAAE